MTLLPLGRVDQPVVVAAHVEPLVMASAGTTQPALPRLGPRAPPPALAARASIEVAANEPPARDLQVPPDPPSRQEVMAAVRRVPITLYFAPWCPACQKARAWFRGNGLLVSERDIEADASLRAMMLRLNPSGSVPTIDVDGTVLTGFSEQRMQRAISEAAQRRIDQPRD